MKEYNITWLAEEAGLQMSYPIDHPMAKFIMAIEARAAEKEREACADLCETWYDPMWIDEAVAGKVLADAIRARGQG